MNGPRGPLRSIASLVAVAVVALAMAGCTKKLTSFDPSYTSPEGRVDAGARQIVQPDLPTTMYLVKLKAGNCDECVDTLVSTTSIYPAGPGVTRGMIFDGTAANSYEILRRELNGGYAPLSDYALSPSQRFAHSGWKLFTWQDPRPSGFDPPTYLGRGLVSGTNTPTTPLTNVAINHEAEVQDLLVGTPDHLRTFGFSHVDSAVAYILQVYAMRTGDENAAIHNAAPAPYATQDQRDYLVAWLPINAEGIDAANAKVLVDLPFVPLGVYLMRASAVDSRGRLIAYSYGSLFEASAPDGYARLFQGGAYLAQAPPAGSLATSEPLRFIEVAAPARARVDPLNRALRAGIKLAGR